MDFQSSLFTGDYKFRQQAANAAGVDLYLEYHFNYYSKITNYTLVKVPANAKPLSLSFAAYHSALVKEYTGVPLYNREELGESNSGGILYCKKSSRDAYNFSLLNAPSVIIEPLFLSNPQHVELLVDNNGLILLANILVATIKHVLPNGGHVGFSVGHKYQKITPMDRGSMAVNHPEFTEADMSDRIVHQAMFMLDNKIPAVLHHQHVTSPASLPQPPPLPTPIQNQEDN